MICELPDMVLTSKEVVAAQKKIKTDLHTITACVCMTEDANKIFGKKQQKKTDLKKPLYS